MNYAGNTEINRKHFIHDHQETLCTAVPSFIPLRKFKELSKIFKDYIGKFKDFSRISHSFSIFKDFSRPVRTMVSQF